MMSTAEARVQMQEEYYMARGVHTYLHTHI